MLSHFVFFTLKEASPAACDELVAACKNYLADNPGTVHFSAGTRAEQYQREVNDADFHVALHVVFENTAAHDQYQVAERHLQFISENKENWEQVRVFDSNV